MRPVISGVYGIFNITIEALRNMTPLETEYIDL